MDSAELGRLIRFKRLQRGMTLDQLATKIGFSGAHISRIEAGLRKRPIEPFVLARIAEALETPIDEFESQPSKGPLSNTGPSSESPSREDVWARSFWLADQMLPVPERLARLRRIAPSEADRFASKLARIADEVLSVGEELRQVFLLDEGAEALWWLEVGKVILESLNSDRSGIAQVDIFSLRYSKANTSTEPHLEERLRSLSEIVASATAGFDLIHDARSKSIDHAWSYFWLLREMGNLSGTLAVFAGAWTTGADQLLGFCRSFQPAETEFSGVEFPPRPLWVRAYDKKESNLVSSELAPAEPDFLLRAATVATRANDALVLFANAERWGQEFIHKLENASLSLSQAAKLCRWNVDLANIQRDRIQLLSKLRQLDSHFGYSISVSGVVREGSLSECEAQIRDAIRRLMVAIRTSPEETLTARRTLASLHIELAFLYRVWGSFEHYKDAIWNHLIACSLDPRRLAAGDSFNASIGSTVTDRLRRKEFDAFAVELEARRINTNFESLEYEF